MAARNPQIEQISSLGLRAWSGRVRGMPKPHRHDDLELNLLLGGACEYRILGRRVPVPDRRLLLLWGAVPHRSVRVTEDATLIWTTVSLRDVLGWSLDAGLLETLLRRGWLVDPAYHEADEPMMRRWVGDLDRDRDTGCQAVLLELEARLRRLGASAAGRSAGARPRGASASERAVMRIERLIADRFRQALSVGDIADAVGLHPNYIMGLFREHTGQTLVQAVTAQRIAFAQRRLALTDDSVLDICLDAGFGSTSRFYEAFGREVGCSPRAYRKRLRA